MKGPFFRERSRGAWGDMLAAASANAAHRERGASAR
jgi:hypothetical protein